MLRARSLRVAQDLNVPTVTRWQIARDEERLAATREQCVRVVLRHMRSPADGYRLLDMLGLLPDPAPPPPDTPDTAPTTAPVASPETPP